MVYYASGARTDNQAAGSPDLPTQLQAAWARRLLWHYDQYNWFYLRSRLRPLAISIVRGSSRLGAWDRDRRMISISAEHILSHSWENVLETLRHEMAHQYVDEVLGVANADPHGAEFREAAKLLRCDAAHAARPGGLEPLESSASEEDKLLRRVKELLALATSPNEHEAASAMRMANKYLVKYNLDLARIEEPRRHTSRWLATCFPRVQQYQYTLGSILQDHFFVRVIWVTSYDPLRDQSGRAPQAIGTPENIEIAAYVHDFVMGLTERLWAAHRALAGRAKGTKQQYLAGLLRGFRGKLDSQKDELKQEYGLVWQGEGRLTQYFQYLYPRVVSAGAGGVLHSDAYVAGVDDGKHITLHRAVKSTAGDSGRLLPRPE